MVQDEYEPNVPAQTRDPFIGRMIAGKFLIERLVGSGAMGKVYEANHEALSRRVAIKVLHRHLMTDENLARRFHREAKAASRLNHPNSITIIDFGQEPDGVLYIAMEYLDGESLDRLLARQFPLPLDRLARIVDQVCLALDEAHHHNIVHRDLKPENIMILQKRTEADFVKVCDFGIAKIQDPKVDSPDSAITIAGMVCGTPEYMSPEQAEGKRLDGRSDLYSLGIILYEAVTGQVPFSGDSAKGKTRSTWPTPPPISMSGQARNAPATV